MINSWWFYVFMSFLLSCFRLSCSGLWIFSGGSHSVCLLLLSSCRKSRSRSSVDTAEDPPLIHWGGGGVSGEEVLTHDEDHRRRGEESLWRSELKVSGDVNMITWPLQQRWQVTSCLCVLHPAAPPPSPEPGGGSDAAELFSCETQTLEKLWRRVSGFHLELRSEDRLRKT